MDSRTKIEEIEQNYKRFMELLPTLVDRHPGQYALLRDREIVGCYESAIAAQVAGNQRFKDHLFSIQAITQTPEHLGFFAHALPRR